MKEEKIKIITLHNPKQMPSKRPLDYIHRLKDTALGCYDQYEIAQIFINNILHNNDECLENIDIPQFAVLLQNAHKTTASVKSFTAGKA